MSSNSKQNQHATEVAKVDDAYFSAVLVCFSRVFPAILNAAIDLDLFEIMAKAQKSSASSLSASEIASLLPNQHPDLANRLERILPLLASYSLLNCSIRTNQDGKRERVYALSLVGAYFACDNDGSSLAPVLTLMHSAYHDIWKDVKDAIVDPNNNNHFQKVRGMLPYKYMETDNELNHIFNKAMAQSGPLEVKSILTLYKGFEGISTLVDVGGGVGQALKIIISEYPSIKGINFDLPQVIQDAPPHPGIEHVEGDMFERVPKGDAILLKVSNFFFNYVFGMDFILQGFFAALKFIEQPCHLIISRLPFKVLHDVIKILNNAKFIVHREGELEWRSCNKVTLWKNDCIISKHFYTTKTSTFK